MTFKLVPIYSANTEVEAQMIKNLLDNKGIKACLENAIMGTVAPYLVAGGGAGAVKVLVRGKDVEKAKRVIKENQ